MNKYIIPTFWILVANFLFIVSMFFVPFVNELFRGKIFLVPLIIFFLLGLVLTILTLKNKNKIKRKLKTFLLLTGISSSAFFVCILLHNLIYGLLIYLFGQDFWQRTGIGDEPVFFLIAIFLCPICFLIGMIGTGILVVRNRKIA